MPIVSPNPYRVTIEVNELTGQAQMKQSRDIPYPLLVHIFASMLVQVSAQFAAAAPPAAAAAAPNNPFTNPLGNPPGGAANGNPNQS